MFMSEHKVLWYCYNVGNYCPEGKDFTSICALPKKILIFIKSAI